MAKLSIQLMGPLQVALDGEPVTGFASDKVRALLVYLAVEAAQPQRRELLAGLLWGDYPERSARASLRNALANLRQAIGDRQAQPPYLYITHQAIQLDPEANVWVDATAFTQRVGGTTDPQARMEEPAQRLEAAVSLYRGGFLEGFSLPDSPAFEEWTLLVREQLQRQMLEALQALVEHDERRGDLERALAHARRQVELEPYPEAAQRQFMRLLALNGQRALALAQYEGYCHLLAGKLGVAPGQETVDLYEAIRGGKVLAPEASAASSALPPLRTHNLPAPSTPFVGRERELAEVNDMLARPEVRLVTVVGPGGMGKSRLALEVARRALGRYRAGAWLVDLAPLPAGASLPRATAAALGVVEQPGRALTEVIVGALQTRQLLLVLDNCEQLGDAVSHLVDTLLSRCPELTLLATSREPLHVPGEHLYDVPPMEVPSSQDLTGLERPVRSVLTYDALQLFAQRARAVRPGFTLDEGTAPLATEVCRRLDGMPLAIELAAARLRALSLAEVAAHLDDRFRLLIGGSRAALPRQQTLRDTVSWSYDLLDEQERLLFDRLSVFAGSFSLAGAEVVCSGEGIQQEEVLERLARLVDQSLVGRAEGPGGTTRYRLLETLRAYGQERLAERGESEQVARRRAWYYVALAEGLEPDLLAWDVEMLAALARLDAEADNLAAAMRWSLARQEPEVAVRIGGAIRMWTEMRWQHLIQYAEWLECALEQEGRVELPHQVKALGVVGSGTAHIDKAIAALEKALALARRTGDARLIGRALCDLGRCHLGRIGPDDQNRSLAEEALRIGRECSDRVVVIEAQELLAWLVPALTERVAMLEELLPRGPYCTQLFQLMDLGRTAFLMREWDKAAAWYRRALDRSVELGTARLQAHALLSLTRIARWRGHVDETMALLERSRELCRQTGDMRSLSYVFFQMTMLAWRQGHLDEASRYIEQHIDIRRELSERRMAPPLGQAMLALLSCEQGAYDRAEALCAQALDSPLADPFARGQAFSALGRVALCRGDGARAVREYRKALRHMQLEQNLHVLDHVEYLAWALAADGQAGEAARLLGFVGRQREVSGPALRLVDRPYHERALETVRGALSEADLVGAWAAGETLELEAAVEGALTEAPDADPPAVGEEEA